MSLKTRQLTIAAAVALNTWLLLGIIAASYNIPNTVAKLPEQKCDCAISTVWNLFDRYALIGGFDVSLTILIVALGSAALTALFITRSPNWILERLRYFRSIRNAALKGEVFALIVVTGIIIQHYWVGGQFFYTPMSTSTTTPTASIAPNFQFRLTDGTISDLYSISGKPVLLEFFSTSCPHCQAEVSELKEVYNHFGDRVVLLSVSTTWGGDTVETCQAFISKFGVVWPTAIDLGRGTSSYHVNSVPQMFLLDGQKHISYTHSGETSASLLIQELETFLQ